VWPMDEWDSSIAVAVCVECHAKSVSHFSSDVFVFFIECLPIPSYSPHIPLLPYLLLSSLAFLHVDFSILSSLLSSPPSLLLSVPSFNVPVW